MITGTVKGDEARIRLKLIGTNGNDVYVQAVVDTGYTGSLSLSPSLIAELGLQWRSMGCGLLADGSEMLFDVYEAVLDWDGKRVIVLVAEADADPLIGMRLLRGHELKVQVRSAGEVTITRLE